MSSAPRVKTSGETAFTTALTVLGGPAVLRVTGAPWWVLCPLGVLGILATILRTVFPQNSQDKVTWWRERWQTRRHCPCLDYGEGLLAVEEAMRALNAEQFTRRLIG